MFLKGVGWMKRTSNSKAATVIRDENKTFFGFEKEMIRLARKAMIIKHRKQPIFKARAYNRCKLCGRPRSYMRKFGLCRICFRELAHKGQLPGVKKSSW